MNPTAEARSPRSPNGLELAGLLTALQAQRHPVLERFETGHAALEFLLDECSIAVFDDLRDAADGDSFSMLLMVMDAGPEYVSSARLDAQGRVTQLAHVTLDDFIPHEEPSRHPPKLLPQSNHQNEPRIPDADDLRELLRMFAAVDEPFMRELRSHAARMQYLQDETRIALFDHCRSGSHRGRLAFLLWPVTPPCVTVAIRATGRWRFSGSEIVAE